MNCSAIQWTDLQELVRFSFIVQNGWLLLNALLIRQLTQHDQQNNDWHISHDAISSRLNECHILPSGYSLLIIWFAS